MGQAYITATEDFINTKSSTWTIYAYLDDLVASGDSFTLGSFTNALGYATAWAKNRGKAYISISAFASTTNSYLGLARIEHYNPSASDGYHIWSPNVWYTGNFSTNNISGATCYTSWLFNSSNPTSRTAQITFKFANPYLVSSNESNDLWNTYNHQDGQWLPMYGGMTTVTLNVPPTFSLPSSNSVTFNTSYVYKGYTTASVNVSSLSAKYGGYITSIKFKIGTQEVENTYTQSSQPSSSVTMSMPLNVSGIDLTPTITVTDSRGQVTSKALNKITIKEYHLPTAAILDVERVGSNGAPLDEGTYALATVKFTCTKDNISNLLSPTTSLVKDDGTSAGSVTFTWYQSRNNSNYQVNTPMTANLWTSTADGGIVYLLIGSNLNENLAYKLTVTPRDKETKSSNPQTRSGNPETATIPAAFFTIDVFAGGHGITFGGPAKTTGFRCEMPTIIASGFKLDLTELNNTASDDYKLNQAISDLNWTSAVIEN